MPTLFTHGIVGLTASQICLPGDLQQDRRIKGIVLGLSVAVSIVPDLDGLFLPLIPYAHPFGHRGLTHSIGFAVVLGAVATSFMIYRWPELKARVFWLFTYFSILTASHGFFDAMTLGGLGIAFFAPFDNTRYFFPVRVIYASPIWPAQFVSYYGGKVLLVELLLIWTVCCALVIGQRKLTPITLPLGGGVAWVVRVIERQHKVTAVALLLLAASAWLIRLG